MSHSGGYGRGWVHSSGGGGSVRGGGYSSGYSNNSGGEGYSSSYTSNPSYSSGIWGGANAVFPPLPSSQPGQSGTASLFPPTPSPSAGPTQPGKKPAFKLRRSIQPRAPLTILNELAGVGGGKVVFEFLDVPEEERRRRAWQADTDVEEVGSFECRCIVQGLEFIAEGVTKAEAKAAVVEIAIQGMISVKCQKNEEEGVGVNEDNCPWSVIASLALYKLYNSWQSQGYTLPPELTSLPGDYSGVGHSSCRGGGAQVGNKVPVERVTMDKPALQLVNEMASRMNMTFDFQLTSEVGTPNDKVFTMAVTVGEKTYSGQGKNKKSAKQAVASAVLEDQDTWYSPPVRVPTPPGIEEEEEDVEEQQPPVKRRTLLNENDMASLLRGDGTPGVEKVVEPDKCDENDTSENTTAGPEDLGLQPGSHPSNIK